MNKRKARFAALIAAVLVIVGCATAGGVSQAATGQTIFGTGTSGINVDPDLNKATLGTQFRVAKAGTVDAVKVHRSSKVTGNITGKLARGSTVLATVTLPAAGAGWQVVDLPSPVSVATGQTYTVYYTAPAGRYSVKSQYTWPKVSGDLTAVKGVYTYGSGVPTSVYQNENYWVDVVFNPAAAPTTSASPTTSEPTTTAEPTSSSPEPTTTAPTTTTQPPASEWPDASNTGVPDGTSLATFPDSGACHLTTANAVYNAQLFNCDVLIKAPGIKITNSSIVGRLVSNRENWPGGSVVVEDSTINGGQQETFPTVSYSDITLTRVEVIGGQHSVQCFAFCTVQDSWLHDQYLPRDSAGHVNAFISNGGNDFVLRHNTLDCSADPTPTGGCTADASFFGDFGMIRNVTLDGNFFVANHAGYCLQAGYNPGKNYPDPENVQVINNVFQRVGRDTTQCGLFGPYTAFKAEPGSVWSGNTWDDGTPLN